MEPLVKTALFRALAVGLALAAASATAQQPVYKSTMPGGKVIYSEKPEPGALRVDKIEAPPAKSGISGLTPEERQRAEENAKQRAAAGAASDKQARDLDDARKQLKAAEIARDAGKEPLPGERVGLAGGGTRLTDEYHLRQKKLEGDVEAARRRLTAAEGR